jgi:ligand-binding sensor domain-containing protein/two-component sensor histidine kinase
VLHSLVKVKVNAMRAYGSVKSFGLEFEESSPDCDVHRMHRNIPIHRKECPLNVSLHSVITDVGAVRDDLVPASGCNLLKNLHLALCERPIQTSHYLFSRSYHCVLRLALVATVMALLASQGFSQDPRIAQMLHRSWTAKDGAPQDIKAMAQAHDGTLWIATAGGLYNFDGLNFSQFKPAPGEQDLQSTSIKSLLVAKDGALWVGMRQGGAARIVNGHITTTWKSYKTSQIILVSNLRQDPSGRVFACLHNVYIAELQLNGQFHFEQGPTGSRIDGAKGFFLDSSGAMWILLNGHVWKRLFGSNTWVKTQVLGDNFISSDELPDHTIWLADIDGNKDKGRRQHFDSQGRLISSVYDSHTASATYPLGDGWEVVSRFDGLTMEHWTDGMTDDDLRSKKSPDQYKQINGLSSDNMIAMLRDSDGNLWTGTELGVDRFSPARLVRFIHPAADLGAIICSNGGPAWIATFAGPLYSVTGDIKTTIPQVHGTHFLNCGRAGAVWGVDNKGLWNAGSGHLRRAPMVPGWESYGIGSFAQFDDDSLIVGLRTNSIWVLKNNRWSPFTAKGTLPEVAWTMLVDGPNKLWIGELTDLYLVEDGKSRLFAKMPSGLGAIEVMANTSHGMMFAALSGVAVIKDGGIRVLSFADERLGRGVAGLVESRDHDVWINGAKGIVRIPGQQIAQFLGGQRKTIEAEKVTEGDYVGPASLTEHNPAAAIDGTGRLWFATINGAVSLNPGSPARKVHLPQLSLLDILGDNNALGDDRTFRPHLRNLQIRYRGVNLTAPEKTVYRYRLDGVDKEWQDAGTRTVAIYTELKPSRYFFHVQASNGDGVWTETVSSPQFSVSPAYYQTWWFYMLCVLAGCIGGWLLLALRMHHLALAIQRSAEHRADERIRIARELHDTLLQGVSGLLLSFHVASEKIAPDHESRSLLERSLTRADQILIEGRNRVNDLRAEQIKDEELVNCLNDVAADLNGGRHTIWRVARTGANRVLRTTIADETFYIAREAMNNAFRHAEATEIAVELVYGRKQFTLACRDNGKGFNFETAQLAGGRWGLRGMKERSLRIGADLSVDSTSGQGSKVKITIPAWRAYRDRSWIPFFKAQVRALFGGGDFHFRKDD